MAQFRMDALRKKMCKYSSSIKDVIEDSNDYLTELTDLEAFIVLNSESWANIMRREIKSYQKRLTKRLEYFNVSIANRNLSIHLANQLITQSHDAMRLKTQTACRASSFSENEKLLSLHGEITKIKNHLIELNPACCKYCGTLKYTHVLITKTGYQCNNLFITDINIANNYLTELE